MKPAVAIGHVMLEATDVLRSARFYVSLGLRPVFERKDMAILELRGGTHLMIFEKEKPQRSAGRTFDFMVEDVPSVHGALAARGVATSAIRSDQRSGHSMFDMTDPDGHVITVYSDHTEGRTV